MAGLRADPIMNEGAKPAGETAEIVETPLRGIQLLSTPLLNKGTAFSEAERETFGLHGLLPPHVITIEQQLARIYAAYKRCYSDLDRHIFLRDLQDRNEVLFYTLLRRHTREMLPMVYAPVVAQGCQYFSNIYRKPRGLYLSYPLRDRFREILANRPNKRVDVIVVTDGERVLGIGDQGVGGMGIPIGKLTLYTLLGGVHPSRTLPILLDVGTNNDLLRGDPLYLGWRNPRITGDAYWEFIEKFVAAVSEELPDVLLQWEDFAKPHARPILERYHDRLCTFNDDIQGTAAVALGAVLAALRVTNRRIAQEKVVVVGAGSAGTGVAEYLLSAMIDDGLDESSARRRFFLVDADGLLHDRMAGLSPIQRRFAQPAEAVASWGGGGPVTLLDVMRHAQPSILIGCSAQPGLFSEAVVREMARGCGRPVIFPLSNPTERAEAKPVDLYAWTEGRALVATGSPFPPVHFGGRRIPVAQSNNLYIFPAVGLAEAAVGLHRITDGMLRSAARALAECSPAIRDPEAPLLPQVEILEPTSRHLAFAIAKAAQHEGHAPVIGDDELRHRIKSRFWHPEYPQLRAVPAA
jgi:malate dehydrogenase (oxaloacetate-decarboxylating)